MGTTGTIMGVSQYLKEKNPGIVIAGCQPADNSQIPGIRKWPKAYIPKIFDAAKIDRIIEVTEKQAKNVTKRLAREEGIFCGMSSVSRILRCGGIPVFPRTLSIKNSGTAAAFI
jgi:cysteine synthase B